MKKFILIFLILFLFTGISKAQETVIAVEPLFEYPVAPESLESLEDKCDYLVKNFWNDFNFKSKQPVDQYALNEAFQVYTTTFQFAKAKEVDSSIDKLIKNLSGNSVLLLQFCKAVEENLYGPRAEFWSDEVYLKFLDAVIKDKKIQPKRKVKYETQAAALRASAEGEKAPSFWFLDKERASKQYFPMSTPTLIIFGNPDDTDWRIARVRMDTKLDLNEALQKGKVNILYILPEDYPNWQSNVANYNTYWTIGQSDEIKSKYDLRLTPSIYLVGADGVIIKKNLTLGEGVKLLLETVN